MISDILFDFFGSLVGYNPSMVEMKEQKAFEFLLSNGYRLNYEQFLEDFDKVFVELEDYSKSTLEEFHMYEVGKKFFKKVFDIEVNNNLLREFIKLYIDDWNSGIVYFPETKNLLDYLNKKYRLSIISNTHYPQLIHNNLEKIKIDEYFYRVFTSVEIGFKKPSPKIFKFALNELKIKSQECIFVGDGYETDYLGATGVNIKCYLIDKNDKFAGKVNERIQSIFDLKDIL